MKSKTFLIILLLICSMYPVSAQGIKEQIVTAENDSTVGDTIPKKKGIMDAFFSIFSSKEDKVSKKADELLSLQDKYDSLVRRIDSLNKIIEGFDAVKQRYADSISEKRVAQANEQNAGQIISLKQRMDSICEVYVNGVFNAMMNYVIFSRYDSLAIQSQYELFDLMELDKRIIGNKRKDKDFYYPRFKEYGVITRQISMCIDMTITDVEAKTERVGAKELFLSRIEKTGYKKEKYKYQYLDEIIEEAKQLFEDPKKYNVKEFEKLKDKLKPRKW